MKNHLQSTGQLGVLRIQAEYRLIASSTIAPGTFLFRIEGDVTRFPTRYSVQIGHSTHIDISGDHDLQEILDYFYWRFMNHHCEPNTVVRECGVFALREIHPWEQITFNYNTTEYKMAEPFACRCGSESCQGVILGFSGLSTEEQRRLRPWLADHLLDLLVEGMPTPMVCSLSDGIEGSLSL